jgi:RNA polymerase sigma-70 factor, ECF subfamily
VPSLAPAHPTPFRPADDPDLWDLVDQVRAGNPNAFGVFVHATVGGIYPYVLRRVLGDRQAAEEIVAEVYLAAWRSLHSVRRVAGSPVAWLRTIAQRRTIDYHRARNRRHDFPVGAPEDLATYQPAAAVAEEDAGPEVICIERDQARALARALWAHVRQLSADQHKVLRCRYQYGMSIEETAAALGKPPTAVKTLQYRAMRTLRGRLRGSALDPTGRSLVAVG